MTVRCAVSSILNPLNAELNPIRHLLALVGARHIVHVSRIKVKSTHHSDQVNLSVCFTVTVSCLWLPSKTNFLTKETRYSLFYSGSRFSSVLNNGSWILLQYFVAPTRQRVISYWFFESSRGKVRRNECIRETCCYSSVCPFATIR